MTEVAIIFAVNVLSSVLKKWVQPRWGKLGVQASVFVLAVIAALYMTYGKTFAPLQEIVVSAMAVFALSVTLYEVLLKYLPFFKKGKL